jgi:hypothetical protein
MSNDHQQVQRRSGVEPMSPNHDAALAFLNPGLGEVWVTSPGA